jgi:hypothetical protein
MAARLAALATVRPPTCKPEPQHEPLDGFVRLSGMLIPSTIPLARAGWAEVIPGLHCLSIGSIKVAQVKPHQREHRLADDLEPVDGVLTPIQAGEPPVFSAQVYDRYKQIASGYFTTLEKAQRFAVEWALVTRWGTP